MKCTRKSCPLPARAGQKTCSVHADWAQSVSAKHIEAVIEAALVEIRARRQSILDEPGVGPQSGLCRINDVGGRRHARPSRAE